MLVTGTLAGPSAPASNARTSVDNTDTLLFIRKLHSAQFLRLFICGRQCPACREEVVTFPRVKSPLRRYHIDTIEMLVNRTRGT